MAQYGLRRRSDAHPLRISVDYNVFATSMRSAALSKTSTRSPVRVEKAVTGMFISPKRRGLPRKYP